MGNQVTKEKGQESAVLTNPRLGEASDLYWACRGGDFDTVKNILSTTPFSNVNHLEANGSTALHAASFFGHVNVVRYLLQERGIFRHRKNRFGLTAYQEAATEEIRHLFLRPSSANRFYDEGNSDLQPFTFSDSNGTIDGVGKDTLEKPDGCWVEGHTSAAQIQNLAFMQKMIASSPLLLPLYAQSFKDKDNPSMFGYFLSKLKDVIDEHVPTTHREYDKCNELLNEYKQTGKVEHLIRLYTLESPFYKALGYDNYRCLSCPLYIALNTLKDRSFQGQSYRGLSMSRNNLLDYQWALENKESVLRTRSFCSTSTQEQVALRFAGATTEDKISVLMIYEFSETCDTAIELSSRNGLHSITDFENEQEVLVLPWTLFHVADIEKDSMNGSYRIRLLNIRPKFSILEFLKQPFHAPP